VNTHRITHDGVFIPHEAESARAPLRASRMIDPTDNYPPAGVDDAPTPAYGARAGWAFLGGALALIAVALWRVAA
jgi:hypothetical protein